VVEEAAMLGYEYRCPTHDLVAIRSNREEALKCPVRDDGGEACRQELLAIPKDTSTEPDRDRVPVD
jgi:hypothetical protein